METTYFLAKQYAGFGELYGTVFDDENFTLKHAKGALRYVSLRFCVQGERVITFSTNLSITHGLWSSVFAVW